MDSEKTKAPPHHQIPATEPQPAAPKTKPKRPVTVRLTPALLEGCHEIEKLCFRNPWSVESLKLLTGGIGTGYAVLDNHGNVAAYGGMLYTVDEGQITNIGVRPEYRRLGFGRAIVRALLADAWQNKLDRGPRVQCRRPVLVPFARLHRGRKTPPFLLLPGRNRHSPVRLPVIRQKRGKIGRPCRAEYPPRQTLLQNTRFHGEQRNKC